MTKFGGNAGGDGGDNAKGEDGADLSFSSVPPNERVLRERCEVYLLTLT